MNHSELLPLVFGLLAAATLPSAAADGARIIPKPSFSATLRPDGQTFVIDVRFHNPTSDVVKLGYGSCAFSYVLRVGSKQYTYPMSQPFALPKVCIALLNAPSIAVRSSQMLFSTPVRKPLERALKAAKSKFAGEFHFKYALVGQPLIIHVYKTP